MKTTLLPTQSRISTLLAWVLLSFIFTSSMCSPKMAMFSQAAANECQEIKTEALQVMELATQPYDQHKNKVEALMSRIEDHIESEKDRGANNETSVKMWQKMIDPQENLLAGFLNRWKAQGQLSEVFVNEVKKIVGENFDKIYNLEMNKRRSTTG